MSESDSIQVEVIYKEVAGHPGYRVGTDGSVWCCLINTSGPKRTNKRHPVGPWRKLKPWPARKGYLMVTMPGKKNKLVHHLVLEAFVGLRPPKSQGCHFPDTNVSNNNLSNLSWGTQEVNWQHRKISSGHAS